MHDGSCIFRHEPRYCGIIPAAAQTGPRQRTHVLPTASRRLKRSQSDNSDVPSRGLPAHLAATLSPLVPQLLNEFAALARQRNASDAKSSIPEFDTLSEDSAQDRSLQPLGFDSVPASLLPHLNRGNKHSSRPQSVMSGSSGSRSNVSKRDTQSATWQMENIMSKTFVPFASQDRGMIRSGSSAPMSTDLDSRKSSAKADCTDDWTPWLSDRTKKTTEFETFFGSSLTYPTVPVQSFKLNSENGNFAEINDKWSQPNIDYGNQNVQLDNISAPHANFFDQTIGPRSPSPSNRSSSSRNRLRIFTNISDENKDKIDPPAHNAVSHIDDLTSHLEQIVFGEK